MAVLKNNEYKTTFWGAKNEFITGLDPLGLQNTSVAAYSYLLPGVTNLTNRIRYYGLYCWLFEYYARHIRETDPQKQNNFIRKAELMMALIMKSKNPDFSQVTGSRFAGNLISGNSNDFYDLEANAVKTGNNKTYWKFSSGAFGQYYAGAMHEIGLTMRNDNGNFICTNETHHNRITGVDVARAFEENVDKQLRSTFIQNITSGRLPVDQIDELYQGFALNNIVKGSSEWSIYCDFLIQEDHPLLDISEESQITYHRKNTIEHLLESIQFLNEFNGWEDFTRFTYSNKDVLKESTEDTLPVWYIYHLNELWHYGAGTVFWGMLDMLDQKFNLVQLPLFVNAISNEIISFLAERFEVNKTSSLHEAIGKISVSENTIHWEIEKAIKEKYYGASAGLGMALIFSIYNSNKDVQEPLQQLVYTEGIGRDGNILEMLNFIEQFQGSLEKFVNDFILRNIIYRHQFVALRKTGGGTQSTLKFLLEENNLRHIESFTPQFTSPRLNAVLRILGDLGFIDSDFNVTNDGEHFLKTQFNGNS